MKSTSGTKLHLQGSSLHFKRSIALFALAWTVIIGMTIFWDHWETQNRISQAVNILAQETAKKHLSGQPIAKEQEASFITAQQVALRDVMRGAFFKYTIIWLVGLLGIGWTLRHIKQRIKMREKLEQAVFENELNLRQALNAIGYGLVSIDMEGNITELNPVAEDLIGRFASDVVGSPFADIFDLTISQSSTTVDAGSADMDGPYSRAKVRLKDAKGCEHTIYCDVTTIKDAEAKPAGSVLVFRDMTKEGQLQEELLTARQLEAVAILAGGMAHDFNNLFTSLFGNIQLAMIKLDKDHPSYTSLVKATQAFEQGKDLTSQLLTFTRGGNPLLEETALEPILFNSTQLIENNTISVKLNLPDDLWPVMGDPRQLTQVFINLFSNAAEALPPGGSLKIEAENYRGEVLEYTSGSGNYVMILVQDNGCGIAPAAKNKVFDIFFTTKAQGRGLGLAIVHRIISKHNGFIKLDSEPGAGTTFTIYLPAVVDVASTIPLAASVEGPVAEGVSILVVDDDELIRDFTEELLKASGYQVDTISTGEEAVEKYFSAKHKEQPYAAVIMDLFMPGGMTGDIACKELLARDPAARIIAVSGYFNDNTMAEFSDAGFKGRLLKPFTRKTLTKELSRVLALK